VGCEPIYCKLSHTLLWAGSRAARGKTKVSGTPNRLNDCVTFRVHTLSTNVAAGGIIQTGGPWVGDLWRWVSVADTEDLFKKGAMFVCFVFFGYAYAPSCMVHDMTSSISIFRFSRQSSQKVTQNSCTVGRALNPTGSLLPIFMFLANMYCPFGCAMMVVRLKLYSLPRPAAHTKHFTDKIKHENKI